MRKLDFKPKRDGFHFVNTFDNYKFAGPITLDFGGRCGGMSYGVADYFYHKIDVPKIDSLPKEGSVLSSYISQRQGTSTWSTVDKWVELNFNPFGQRTSEFFHWGIQETGGGRAQQLKQAIDHGHLAQLGMFNPDDMIKSHRTVAYGYEGSGENLKIFIYDPNHPDREMVLRPHQSELRYYYDDVDYSRPGPTKWLTYFVDLNYRVTNPPHGDDPGAAINWSHLDMSGKNLSNQNYRNGVFIGTNFRGANISQTDFGHANLRGANFYGANLEKTNFSHAELEGANFYGADLKVATLSNADASGCSFVGASCQLGDHSGADLHGCDFHGADVHQANLSGTNCRGSNFYGANLSGSNLEHANLRGANLTGADLSNTKLKGANFTGANLRGANLGGAETGGAIGI